MLTLKEYFVSNVVITAAMTLFTELELFEVVFQGIRF